MTDEREKLALAEQAWRRMFGFLMFTRPRRDAVLARLGLTPNDAKAIYSLDPERPRTMSELAKAWDCDASTATWIVDRLERLGLAERRSDARDRRVRQVVLTASGTATKSELLEGMFATPPELLDLTTEQLRELSDLLARLPAGLDEFPESS